MNRDIYYDLIEVAKTGGTTTYGQIAPIAGLDLDYIDDRNRLSEILMEISQDEHSKGRPMLSAVVVNEKTKIPGKGFFTLARDIGIFDGGDETAFFERELAKVHKHDYSKSER